MQRQQEDPLKQHDFGMVKQIKEEAAKKAMGAPIEYTGRSGGVMTKLMPQEGSKERIGE